MSAPSSRKEFFEATSKGLYYSKVEPDERKTLPNDKFVDMAEVEESDDKSDGPGTPRSRQLVFSEMPTPAKTPVSTEMDSAERESLK